MEAEALVSDYLGRLEQAAQPLAADRRGELIAEVQDHIESALTEAGSRDEVTARNVLERLGAPEEIVAAETGGDGSPAATPPPTPVVERGGRWGTMDLAALLFLTVGAIFLPVVGPLDRNRAGMDVHHLDHAREVDRYPDRGCRAGRPRHRPAQRGWRVGRRAHRSLRGGSLHVHRRPWHHPPADSACRHCRGDLPRACPPT